VKGVSSVEWVDVFSSYVHFCSYISLKVDNSTSSSTLSKLCQVLKLSLSLVPSFSLYKPLHSSDLCGRHELEHLRRGRADRARRRPDQPLRASRWSECEPTRRGLVAGQVLTIVVGDYRGRETLLLLAC